MATYNLVERVARLEAQMQNLEEKIVAELVARKETQEQIMKEARDTRTEVMSIKQKVWIATGFLMAAQLGLSIFIKWVFK